MPTTTTTTTANTNSNSIMTASGNGFVSSLVHACVQRWFAPTSAPLSLSPVTTTLLMGALGLFFFYMLWTRATATAAALKKSKKSAAAAAASASTAVAAHDTNGTTSSVVALSKSLHTITSLLSSSLLSPPLLPSLMPSSPLSSSAAAAPLASLPSRAAPVSLNEDGSLDSDHDADSAEELKMPRLFTPSELVHLFQSSSITRLSHEGMPTASDLRPSSSSSSSAEPATASDDSADTTHADADAGDNEPMSSIIGHIEMDTKSSPIHTWPAPSCPFASQLGTPLAELPPTKMSYAEDIRALKGSLCYLRDFLAKPHANLGRKGPTCPFVPTALKKDSIYVCRVRTKPSTGKDQIVKLVEKFIDKFFELEPKSGSLTSYKAIVITFPYMPLADAPALIDGVQAALKPFFVAKGLMIGEFHLANNATGLHNPSFYPLRTPYPCLAIRNMVPADLVFLSLDQYPASLRVSFLESYLSNFNDATSAKGKDAELRRSAQESLDAARAQTAVETAPESAIILSSLIQTSSL